MKNTKKAGITIIALILIALVTTIISVSVNLNSDKNEPSTPDAENRPTVETTRSTIDNTSTKPENKPAIIITAEEREMLAKIAQLEASLCSNECQRAVVSVIFNRLHSHKWRKDMNNDGQITLYDIIYYPNAFTPVLYGKMDNCIPTQRDYDAVDYVLENGVTVPTYVRYFRTDYDFNWEGYENYKVIDNVYFGYFTDWENGAW